jgi:FkbM family methyltransferase
VAGTSKLTRAVLRRLPSFLARAQSETADETDIYFAYRLLLGRAADRAGQEIWLRRMDNGMRHEQLIASFLAAPEFRRREGGRRATRVELASHVIYVDASELGVSPPILANGSYEPHVTALLRRELKPDSVFLDVGCNIGWFLLLAAATCPAGKAIGIEPSDGNLQLLYRSIAANRFCNVDVLPYAATDRRQLLQLAFHAAAGLVHGVDEGSGDPFVQGAPVDELVAREPRIDVVKLDIEGHEPLALRGMARTIERHRPLIVTEFHPRLIREHAGCDAVAYLEALIGLGYAISLLTPEGVEVDQPNPGETMKAWQACNAQAGMADETHVDLVARAVERRRELAAVTPKSAH